MRFEPKVPVDTREPVELVEGLPAGVHRFSLEVVDDRRRRTSAPAFVEVDVTKDERRVR